MTLEAELEELMAEIVTLEAPAALSGAASASYAAGKPWKARIEHRQKRVYNREGQEVTSSTQVYMPPQPIDGSPVAPTIDFRVTLPAGYAPTQPPILSVERHNDDQGLHHWVLNL
jgi:hypothetical protein